MYGVVCPNEAQSLPALVDPVRVRVAVTASSTLPGTPLMTAQTLTDGVSSDIDSEELCILISALVAIVWEKGQSFVMKEVPQLTKQLLTVTSYCVEDMAKGKECNIMYPTQKIILGA